MEGISTQREKFEQFLALVDLDKFRNMYKPLKIVEMDLPKNIHAIDLVYQIYWEERNFVD